MTEDHIASSADFSPEPGMPTNPEFYRRVLDALPSPMLVVDSNGLIVFGNQAMRRLGGWSADSDLGQSVLSYLHPDDFETVAAAFLDLSASPGSAHFDNPWAPINVRLVTSTGLVVPIAVTGIGGLDEPGVNGIIYDVRPSYEEAILRRGLTELAQGEPIDAILQLITNMISLPPLGLDAAVLEPLGDGRYRVIGATNPTFESILQQAQDPQPWNSAASEPHRTVISQFPGGVGEDLFAAGYRDFWHVAPELAGDKNSYRIVAAGAIHHVPATGPFDRLIRANELASVVLLRARTDALLEYSATHDRLTQLPNRDGFYRRANEALAASESSSEALLFIDLDGFKEVNDQHGHAAGDIVLATLAARLVAVTRSIDVVGRLGGDEFAVLIGATTGRPADAARIRVICDRALQELRRAIDIDGTSVQVAASIGAVLTESPAVLEDLLAQADAAMYEAKRARGDRYHIIEL